METAIPVIETVDCLEIDAAIHFRTRFKLARKSVERDNNNWIRIIQVLESLGQTLVGRQGTLRTYEGAIYRFVRNNYSVKNPYPNYRADFRRLYTIVRQGRNTATHEGAHGRYFAPRVVELSLILEDALLRFARANKVKDYMSVNPVTVQTWEQLNSVRGLMLQNSFSHIPYFDGETWRVVSDIDVVRYIRPVGDYLKERIDDTLAQAIETGLPVHTPMTAQPDSLIRDVVSDMNQLDRGHLPVLVYYTQHSEHLLGILTAFDLM